MVKAYNPKRLLWASKTIPELRGCDYFVGFGIPCVIRRLRNILFLSSEMTPLELPPKGRAYIIGGVLFILTSFFNLTLEGGILYTEAVLYSVQIHSSAVK